MVIRPIDFSNNVLNWFERFGRKNLPWQQNPNPYRVWLSEIMLQQTQVATVIDYFERFTNELPTLVDLAQASDDKLMSLWSGLGYYSRARNLHKTAKILMQDYQGEFPSDIESLMSLPGIGRSTAGAIRSLAFGKPAAILDGNVKRVLARHHAIAGWPGKSDVLKQLWLASEQLTPALDTAKYNQAMMDIGATVCTRTNPSCQTCPVSSSCQAFKSNTIELYPGKKPKKQMPTKHRLFFMLIRNNQLLMIKRPNSGIWGGLWTPLSIELTAEQADALNHQGFKHTFSHYHLICHQLVIPSDTKQAIAEPETNYQLPAFSEQEHRWATKADWQKQGIPKAVHKMLESLDL
jgi:A/G-specific adenine glycosylase